MENQELRLPGITEIPEASTSPCVHAGSLTSALGSRRSAPGVLPCAYPPCSPSPGLPGSSRPAPAPLTPSHLERQKAWTNRLAASRHRCTRSHCSRSQALAGAGARVAGAGARVTGAGAWVAGACLAFGKPYARSPVWDKLAVVTLTHICHLSPQKSREFKVILGKFEGHLGNRKPCLKTKTKLQNLINLFSLSKKKIF